MSYTIRAANKELIEFYVPCVDEGDDDRLPVLHEIAVGDLRLGFETAIHEHDEKTKCVPTCAAYVTAFRPEFANITQILRSSQVDA